MSIPSYRSQTIPVLSIPPNESDPIKLRLIHNTTITEALDMSEERQARLPRPLYSLDFSTLSLTNDELAYLRNVIEMAAALPVACPIWPLKTKLTAPYATTDLTIFTDATRYCAFDVFNQYAIIWESFSKWEVIEIDFVHSRQISILTVLSQAYSTAAFVIPLMYGNLPRQDINNMTDEHGAFQCQFEETFHRLHDQSVAESDTGFDDTLCLMDFVSTTGGGDSFDCYVVGSASNLPSAGSRMTGNWKVGNNVVNYANQESFDSYTVGVAATLADEEDGFSSADGWKFSDNTIQQTYFDDFNSYTVGTPATDTLGLGTGWTGNWQFS